MSSPIPVLYGMLTSPYVQRSALALYECDQEFESNPISSITGEHKTPEFLAINPFGKIPTYKDEDITLSESRAIARYVFEKHPEKAGEMLGSNPLERADVNKWVDIEATSFDTTIRPIMDNGIFAKFLGRPADEGKLNEGAKKMGALLDCYEKHLEKHDFLACDRLTFADLTHAPLVCLLDVADQGDLISSRPHVAAWWERVSSCASWKRVLDGPTVMKIAAERLGK